MQSRQTRTQSNRYPVHRDATFAELHKLEQNVALISQRNRQKYDQILSDQPQYSILLYQPNDKLRTQKAFRKQLLLKQLDKLMDQESIFDKKIAQLRFLKQLEHQQQEKILDKDLNPYQALRTVWAKHQTTAIKAKNSFDRLESLNFTIGIIKNTVMGMKLKEQKCLANQPSTNMNPNTEKYEKLLQNYERSMMVNQQLRQQINKLHIKLQSKQHSQQKLIYQLLEKENQIKAIKKIKDLSEIDHKFIIAQLKQEIHLLQKKIDKMEKWKSNLEKNYIQDNSCTFKIYFQLSHQNMKNEALFNRKETSKNLSEIQAFFHEYTQSSSDQMASNNPELANLSKTDQQNSETIIIPSLSLTEQNQQICMRKRIQTDRPLKARNFEFQKFVGGKMTNLKFSSRLPTNLNEDSMKKFVRKGQGFGTSRRLEAQYSQRDIQFRVNESN